MQYLRKLKPDRSVLGFLPALISLVGFAFFTIFWGYPAGAGFLFFVFFGFAVISFNIFRKTRNVGFLAIMLFQLCCALYLACVPGGLFGCSTDRYFKFFIVCMLCFAMWVVYLLVTRRIKWRGREIMELAAAPINETSNGYTPRPRPVGRTNFTKEEIIEFAEFGLKNLIFMPYRETNRVVLVPVKMARGYRHFYIPGYEYSQDTWVSFDFEGNVTVNISQEDYFDYKEDLSFDQLCASLGNLFTEFMEIYLRGEGVRIIDRLDSLKICVFT